MLHSVSIISGGVRPDNFGMFVIETNEREHGLMNVIRMEAVTNVVFIGVSYSWFPSRGRQQLYRRSYF